MAGTGCQRDDEPVEPSARLAALLDEPLATVSPGGKLVLRRQLDDHESFGTHINAQVLRVFAYPDPRRATRGREAAIDAAVASGWTMGFGQADPGEALFGAKALATGDATAVIHEYKDGDVYKVSIELEHTSCQASRCGGG